jgi:hypothetical protein
MGCPTQDVVLAQGPVPVEALFEIDEITPLPQSHTLCETGKLIQIGREISNTPNTGLGQFVKFHGGPQTLTEINQLMTIAQVLLGSQCI